MADSSWRISIMSHRICAAALIPSGFALEQFHRTDTGLEIVVRPTGKTSICPECGSSTSRVHSRYRRRLGDLPLAGRPVSVVLIARRFRCSTIPCQRRIFTERFEDGAVLPWARRTARLDLLVYHLGLALGGRPAARFAHRLMTPVSNDTLLRAVRRRGRPGFTPPHVIGIDDWAWRRNHRYGTIICDLELRQPIRLLPDREPATAQAWFMDQPQIAVVARDRGGAYALAAARALPDAAQVADRWHLMENASRAFLEAIRGSMRPIRAAIGATVINPALLSAAERLQYEGYVRREETATTIRRRRASGA